MNKLPQEVMEALAQNGLANQDMVYGMVCDRSIAGGYRDTYVLLSRENLIVLAGTEPVKEKVFKGFAGSAKQGADPPAERRSRLQVETFSIDQIETVSIVNLVASGMIVVHEAEPRAVAAFTNGHMTKAAKLASIFEKLKKQEPIDDDELFIEHEGICPKCGMVYPEEGRAVCPKCMKKHAIFFRLLAFAGQYKGTLAIIVSFMLLNSATGLVIPYLQGTVLFDQALGGSGRFAGQIGLVIALIVVFRTLSLLCGIVFGVYNAKMSAYVVFDLKSNVFAAMQRLSLQFFQKKQTGQLMTRVNNDANELQYFFVDGVSYFIVNAMNIIGIAIVLLVMDWKLTLLCFFPLLFVVATLRRVFPKLWRLSWQRHRGMSTLNSIISDTIRGTRVVKAFGKEKNEIERFQKSNLTFSGAEQSFNKMIGTVFPALTILTQISGLIVWAFGGWKVMHGSLTLGKVITFSSYMYMLYGPIQFMNNIANWWSYCMSAAQRIFEIQDAVPDVAEKPNAVEIEALKGDIEVKNVVFGYEPNKAILRDVSLQVKAGQMIGIVGQSGAGKSTFVNLISRLYDVNEGEIRIDGINVKELTTRSLRRNIGIVSQDVYVFMGTISENIAYADPDCSLADIINAAKIANAHDFIEKLPDGYDTIVGTGGHNLSGGEKQRISIARALLHNPRILILDEATASLDTETELQIQEALEKLAKGRTTIAIAHRLSTLRNADHMLVMEAGKVVEAGTHEQLMQAEGVYFGLVKKHDEALKLKGVG
ncbi:ABC transporter ATP-binding protein [Paenibacillus sp. R14(2021)]|uniref:ABC transporter ATP-binding protein n=1 Tax=Paenibacillus sp. R14(2021) TaxID=2859228 RepID=UPI001C61267A|nr:ABC transporter ATP-binding protein [Paenibacillus sp. R14(2021)]